MRDRRQVGYLNETPTRLSFCHATLQGRRFSANTSSKAGGSWTATAACRSRRGSAAQRWPECRPCARHEGRRPPPKYPSRNRKSHGSCDQRRWWPSYRSQLARAFAFLPSATRRAHESHREFITRALASAKGFNLYLASNYTISAQKVVGALMGPMP